MGNRKRGRSTGNKNKANHRGDNREGIRKLPHHNLAESGGGPKATGTIVSAEKFFEGIEARGVGRPKRQGDESGGSRMERR